MYNESCYICLIVIKLMKTNFLEFRVIILLLQHTFRMRKGQLFGTYEEFRRVLIFDTHASF